MNQRYIDNIIKYLIIRLEDRSKGSAILLVM